MANNGSSAQAEKKLHTVQILRTEKSRSRRLCEQRGELRQMQTAAFGLSS